MTKTLIETIRAAMPALKQEVFVAEYAKTATDEEAIGILLAKLLDWDGLSILRTAEAALEDANFHTESKVVGDLANEIEEGDDEIANFPTEGEGT